MSRILGLGDNVVDCYLDLGKMFPGGNALNVAVLAKRYGSQSAYLGQLGEDPPGKHIYASLTSLGVDVSHVRFLPGSNAYAKVTLVEGDRTFVGGSKGVSQGIQLSSREDSWIQSFDLIHSSIYSGIEDLLPYLHRLGAKLSYDFSNEPAEDYLNEVLPFVSFAFFSGGHMELHEAESFAEQIYEKGPSLVVVTRGSQGALAYDGALHHQGILPVQVVDTLGAGDAFIARILTGITQDESLNSILPAAAKASAEVCQSYGAFGYGVPVEGIAI